MMLLQYLGKFNKFTFQTYTVNHLSNNQWTLYNSDDIQSYEFIKLLSTPVVIDHQLTYHYAIVKQSNFPIDSTHEC